MDNLGQALNANVIIEEIEVKNLTETGLDVSSDVDKNEKYRAGIVKSLGFMCPKDDNGNPYVKVGDTVSYDKYKATDFTKNAVKYQIVHFADLLLVD